MQQATIAAAPSTNWLSRLRELAIRAVDLPSPPLKLLGRVFASDEEVAANPRSRSAVMRIAERVTP